MIESGRENFDSVWHPKKVPSSMQVTPSGILMDHRYTHSAKAPAQIFLTLSGMVTTRRQAQREKESAPILRRFPALENWRSLSARQP